MKKLLIFSLLPLFVMSFFINSCREGFELEFEDVLIVNQPPEVSGLDTLRLATGFESIELDLSSIISDQENDDLTIDAEYRTEGIVTVSLSGQVLTIVEVSAGTVSINLVIDDGIERELTVNETLVVVVEERTVINEFIMDLSNVPDGTLFDEYSMDDGTVIGTVEASEGSDRIVQNGILEWTTDEWDVMSITFPEPLDISSNATFSLQYANLWSDFFGITLIDESGGETGFGWEEAPFLGAMILNDTSFNTFSFDLSEYSGEVDLTAITTIYIEIFGATESETFKVKEIASFLRNYLVF